MAKRVKAIQVYSPRVKLGKRVELGEIVKYIADRTGLNTGEIGYVINELQAAVVHYIRQGRPVKVKGLGTYAPTVKVNGVFDVGFRVDNEIRKELNKPDTFMGEIDNKDMMGKTTEDLVARWNEEHPHNPVKIEPSKKNKKK
jgi:hypothetical protein